MNEKLRLKLFRFMLMFTGFVSVFGFYAYYFVIYSVVKVNNLILDVVAVSLLGFTLLMIWVYPSIRAEVVEPELSPRIKELIEKSWNNGLDAVEREELRQWVYGDEKNE